MANKRIKTLLIANRGEIAVRVIKTAKRMGIRTVAVYSDVDATAMHVAAADEAIHIGPAAASESYLIGSRIIEAAKNSGADAIHPGYGFLSENPAFARDCADAGIIFVGPTPEAMEAMALKDAAKALMVEAGVPVVPGYHEASQELDTLRNAASDIGYPVLIKAVAGGGGKGMRSVAGPDAFDDALGSARREAKNAFGDDRVLIEKLIEIPRHIEVQVFGDNHGGAVHLFERDCSLQRRHQKVIEEAPAPGISGAMRAELGAAAVRAAKAIGYSGAGTIEFIVDVSGGSENAPFYFMEMNTRLQVEHPVTENVTGQDLVEWQLRIAAGEPLPLLQSDIKLSGHAFEVRLYAEDPKNNFMPATGTISKFTLSDAPGARSDCGVRTGDAVTIHYDPMIAKLISYGPDRNQARAAMVRQLQKTSVLGLTTNRDFLLKAIEHPEFATGAFDTGFIERHMETLNPPIVGNAEAYAIAASLIISTRDIETDLDPWGVSDCFRLNLPARETLHFKDSEGEALAVTVDHGSTSARYTIIDETFDIIANNEQIIIDGHQVSIASSISDDMVEFSTPDTIHRIARHHMRLEGADDSDGPGALTAPMPGKILDVLVKSGDHVSKGASLIIMEAMKMEQTLVAGRDGAVEDLSLSVGDQVSEGTLLLTITDNKNE